MSAMHQPVDDSTEPEYTEGDVILTPVTMGKTNVIDVQQIGNPDAYIWFMTTDDELTTEVKP